ncbi:MAG: DUF721 domain-containing protein [Bacteroidota bacterium]
MNKNNSTTFKDAMKAMLEYYRLKSGIQEIQIEKVWAEHMGASINKHTTQIRLIKGKLFVDLDSSSLKQELSYGKEKIKKILNEAMGEEVIKQVFIK